MITYGCKKMFFKMDKWGNNTELVLSDLMSRSFEVMSFHNLTQDQLRDICILSGCDYLPSIKGIGLCTAITLVENHRSGKAAIDSRSRVPLEYYQKFVEAQLTFRHQIIYDLRSKNIVNLEKPAEITNYPFLGQRMTNLEGHLVAIGKIHPTTKIPFPTAPEILYITDMNAPSMFGLMALHADGETKRKEAARKEYYSEEYVKRGC